MGDVIDAFGILGWVKVRTASVTTDALIQCGTSPLLYVNHSWQPYQITQHAVAKAHVLRLKLAEINDRDAALSLKGVPIGVRRDKLPQLASDEYYLSDLIGLTVSKQNGTILGVVGHFIEAGATTVLGVQNPELSKELLIPFIAQYVLAVDLSKRQIIVDWELDY